MPDNSQKVARVVLDSNPDIVIRGGATLRTECDDRGSLAIVENEVVLVCVAPFRWVSAVIQPADTAPQAGGQ